MSGTEAPDSLLPTHKSKTSRAIKAPRAVKRITFDRTEASPGETLYVHLPKLNQDEVLVPGSLCLRFDIVVIKAADDGHKDNYLMQNVSRALVSKMVVKFAAQSCRTRTATTCSKSTRTCSFRKSSATT